MTGLARFPRSWHISNLFKKSSRVHMSGLSGSVPDLNFYRAGSREPSRKFIPYVHSITGMEFFFNYVCHRLGHLRSAASDNVVKKKPASEQISSSASNFADSNSASATRRHGWHHGALSAVFSTA